MRFEHGRRMLLGLLVALAAVTAGCSGGGGGGGGGNPPPAPNLTGTVLDAVTRAAVGGVPVQLTSDFAGSNNVKPATTTTAQGKFSFSNVAAGDYWLHFNKAGQAGTSAAYNESIYSVTIVAGQTKTGTANLFPVGSPPPPPGLIF
jgi:hypothetical protein